MKLALYIALLLAPLSLLEAAAPDLSKITSRADLDLVISASADAGLKQALAENAAAILAAAEQHPHVEAVIRTLLSAPGTFVKINTTPQTLKKAAGGELAVFDTLTLVSTSILNGKAHVYRKASEDPYDAGFIEHVGHITALESLKIVAPKIDESWMAPLLRLNNLKSLSIEGAGRLGDASLAQLQQLTKFAGLTSLELAYFGKATDSGLEHLAGLKNLERFTFRGSPIRGAAFAKFQGWTKLNYIRFHSNDLDDEGLGYVCERFPNLETLNLIHSHRLTDACAVHLLKLSKLKSLSLNGPKLTAAVIKNLSQLPLEFLMLNSAANAPAPEALGAVKAIPTLRRLSLGGAALTDADLSLLASVTQLQDLEIENLDLPEARVPQLQAFSFLKSIAFALRPQGYPPEVQAKVRALLPKVEVKFIQ